MLGVGLGSMLWLWTVAHSFQTSVIKALGAAFSADLIVTSRHIASGFDGVPIEGKLIREVRKIPGVSGAIGERLFDWHYAGGPVAIDSFDASYFKAARFGRWQLYGWAIPNVWEEVSSGRAVIVSTSFIRNLGARVGDVIDLETPRGPLNVIVGGVTVAFASPRGTIEMSRRLYLRYWHDSTVTRVHVDISEGVDPLVVSREIARTLGRRFSVQILSAGELLDYWAVQVRRAFAFVHVLGFVILLVVLVGMADTLAACVADRTRELGIMRAVGVRRGRVRLMVVLEAVTLGLVGLVLAAVGGVGLGLLWVKGTLPQLLGWVLEFHVPYVQGLLAAAVTIGVCVAAAVVPARRASRLEPAIALRYE
jgi:putative ABC transport system permease protein